mgnify:CR=1 FL=1
MDTISFSTWQHFQFFTLISSCLLYTSDAADERSSVDLGGRRIIKKKKYTQLRGGDYQRKKITKKVEEPDT